SQRSLGMGGDSEGGSMSNLQELLASKSSPLNPSASISSTLNPSTSDLRDQLATPQSSAMMGQRTLSPWRNRLPPKPSQQPRLQHRPNPYADVPSLYDLYSQYSGRPVRLERFGMDIFRSTTGNFDELPMDMPVGPEYVLGPGDGLNIQLSGGVSQRLVRSV